MAPIPDTLVAVAGLLERPPPPIDVADAEPIAADHGGRVWRVWRAGDEAGPRAVLQLSAHHQHGAVASQIIQLRRGSHGDRRSDGGADAHCTERSATAGTAS